LRKAAEAQLLVEQYLSLAISSAYDNDSLRKVGTNGGNLVHVFPLGLRKDRIGRQLPSIQVVPN
jgi:hypothetical protein